MTRWYEEKILPLEKREKMDAIIRRTLFDFAENGLTLSESYNVAVAIEAEVTSAISKTRNEKFSKDLIRL